MGMSDDTQIRRQVAATLRAALKEDQFVLYRQAIAPLGRAATDAGYQEILVRFLEEEQKLLAPGAFIPELEELNLMQHLDHWVVNRLLKWIYETRAARPGLAVPRSSVNLSANTLRDPGFGDWVRAQITDWAAPADSLSFEVGESVAAAERAPLRVLAAVLAPLGVQVAVSGFLGTRESFEVARDLGAKIIKLAGGLGANVHRDASACVKVKMISDRCRATGVRTVAERVEEQAALQKLREIGVDYAQGFGIGRPVPLVVGKVGAPRGDGELAWLTAA